MLCTKLQNMYVCMCVCVCVCARVHVCRGGESERS